MQYNSTEKPNTCSTTLPRNQTNAVQLYPEPDKRKAAQNHAARKPLSVFSRLISRMISHGSRPLVRASVACYAIPGTALAHRRYHPTLRSRVTVELKRCGLLGVCGNGGLGRRAARGV
eukprot:1961571-Rhodomonas_salina.1